MSPFQSFSAICLILLAGVFPCSSRAADISTLQTALSLARDGMEKAKSQQDASAQAIAQQQKIVAQRKKQLDDESSRLNKMRQDAKQTQAQYLEAQQRYAKAQANLDAAWGK